MMSWELNQNLLAVLTRIALALECGEDYHLHHLAVMTRIAVALERVSDVVDGSG
jgi:hypothetical protein